MDLSENGQQIAEKLLVLLNDRQRQELLKYICHSLEQPVSAVKHPCATSNSRSPGYIDKPLTEIREGELYFCLELRKVCVGDMEIELTVKEFDALYLLISNRNRILTFETLARQIPLHHGSVTRSPTAILLGFLICGFTFKSAVSVTPYVFAMPHSVSPRLTV